MTMGQLHTQLRSIIAPRELRILCTLLALYSLYHFNRRNRFGAALYISALTATLPFKYLHHHVLTNNAASEDALTVSEAHTLQLLRYILGSLQPLSTHRLVQQLLTAGNRAAGITFQPEVGDKVHPKLPCIGYFVFKHRSLATEQPIATSAQLQQHLKAATSNVYVLFAVHGGGFRLGQKAINNGALYVALQRLCMQRAGIQLAVFSVEYRTSLDGEHCPAASDDVLNAYRWLTQHVGVTPSRIIGFGDSAGGNALLSSVLQMQLPSHQLQPPAGIALSSPWVDLSTSAFDSDIDQPDNDYRDYLTVAGLQRGALAYLGNVAASTSPIASPLHGTFTRDTVPPVFVNYGGREILRYQAQQLVERLVKAGIHTTEVVDERMYHDYVCVLDGSKSAAAALATDEMAQWIIDVASGKIQHNAPAGGSGESSHVLVHVQRVLVSHPPAKAQAQAKAQVQPT